MVESSMDHLEKILQEIQEEPLPKNNNELPLHQEQNYYYTEQIKVKLGDFGLAKQYTENDDNFMMKTLCGSPLYMAPELLEGNKYTTKSDLWSCGIIMYELLFGVHPTYATNFAQLVSKIKSEKINFHTEKNFTSHCFDLLQKLLVKNHPKRMEWDDFFNHKWFKYWEGVFNGDKPLSDLKRTVSLPIKTNYNTQNYNNSGLFDSTSGEYIKNTPSNNSASPLGSSNLSKMKISNYGKSCTPGSYSDYPSSYPPTDPRRKSSNLTISNRSMIDSHSIGTPSASFLINNYRSDVSNTSSRIFKYPYKDTENKNISTQQKSIDILEDESNTKINDFLMEDYSNIASNHNKSQPIAIKKNIFQSAFHFKK